MGTATRLLRFNWAFAISVGSLIGQSGVVRTEVPALGVPRAITWGPPVQKKVVNGGPDVSGGVRTIVFNPRDMPEIHCVHGFTTVLVFPEGEQIMEASGGDQANWTVEKGANLVYVTPEKKKIRSNLNVSAASGNLYSYIVVEGSPEQPDLKVFIKARDAETVAAIGGKPKWVNAGELDAAHKEAEQAKQETERARAEIAVSKEVADKQAEFRVARFATQFPGKLQFDYRWKDRHNRFGIHAMAHSNNQTFIWATPQETPALYERKEGKPNLITFSFNEGVYSVDKVVSDGYLAVGKRRLNFSREE